MTAILNSKMAEKLTYIQLRLKWLESFGITDIMHNHHFNHSVMLRISFYIIHNLCMLYYDGHLEIQDGRQTNQYLT